MVDKAETKDLESHGVESKAESPDRRTSARDRAMWAIEMPDHRPSELLLHDEYKNVGATQLRV